MKVGIRAFNIILQIFKGAFVKRYDQMSKTAFLEIYNVNDLICETVKSGRILDVGCGTGVCAIKIAKNNNYEVVGIDSSKDMIKMCKKNAEQEGVNIDFQVSTFSKLVFEDNSFDMIVSNGSLHHWEKPVEAFNEIYRVLKPEGGNKSRRPGPRCG